MGEEKGVDINIFYISSDSESIKLFTILFISWTHLDVQV